MTIMRVCTYPGCGRPITGGNRCAAHPRNRIRTTAQQKLSASIPEGSTCWICGERERPDDRLTIDHINPRLTGGDLNPDNIRYAHHTCNSRRGQSGIPCATCMSPKHCDRQRACAFPPTRGEAA